MYINKLWLRGDFINSSDILYELNNGKEDFELSKLVEESIIEVSKFDVKSKYKIFKTDELSSILIGNDIKNYTKDSNEVAVFIITLSHDADKKLKYFEKIDKLKYIVFDKVCSHYIEDECEKMQKEINKILLQNNKFVLNRFSTGYGDFPININYDIHKMLDAERIGVFLTDKNMFIPSKTISGIIASGDKQDKFNFCKTCNITKECKLVQEGRRCYE